MLRLALNPPGFRSPHRKRSIAATGGMLARRPLKTNMRQGENAMFEILDRRTSLTGNQIKILAAAVFVVEPAFFMQYLTGGVPTYVCRASTILLAPTATVSMTPPP